MPQTTHTGTRNSQERLADAGPYEYGPLVASGDVAQPAPLSQPAPKGGGLTWKSAVVIFVVTIAAPALKAASGLTLLHCYAILYCVAAVFSYWETPRPRERFLRWALKIVGLFLNFFFALVTVPQSLRGLLPEFWAFALPSFAFLLAFYWLQPLLLRRGMPPFWQWLLWTAGFSFLWGYVGAGATG